MHPPVDLPPAIRTDASNAFAHHTMRVRAPGILRQTVQLNPDYSPAIANALEALAASLEADAPIPPLELPAPDYEEWMAVYALHRGATWGNSQWWFAEIYLYRQVMQAVRWFETGRDPFAPRKQEELDSSALWALIEEAHADAPVERAERLSVRLLDALRGNRIDLSHQAAKHGTDWLSGDLLADERVPAVEHLLRTPGPVHIVVDNTGSELAMDLLLALALIADGRTVVLHVKWHPTFVSDATAADARALIALFAMRLGHDELARAFEAGRLRLAPDPFWNSAHFLWALPPRLRSAWDDAALVIVKGDANYRRLIGDALWPPETPFTQVMAYFPKPLLALRTLKSDGVVGLSQGQAEALDAVDPDWRVNGRRGVVQFKP